MFELETWDWEYWNEIWNEIWNEQKEKQQAKWAEQADLWKKANINTEKQAVLDIVAAEENLEAQLKNVEGNNSKYTNQLKNKVWINKVVTLADIDPVTKKY